MAKKRRTMSSKPAATARTSVSLPKEIYSELEKIADEKKVSVAWVVRDAVSRYIADRYPLFAANDDNRGPR
jgi:metal-responsive CopG/Arc/MetJ family transcriptional regulator